MLRPFVFDIFDSLKARAALTASWSLREPVGDLNPHLWQATAKWRDESASTQKPATDSPPYVSYETFVANIPTFDASKRTIQIRFSSVRQPDTNTGKKAKRLNSNQKHTASSRSIGDPIGKAQEDTLATLQARVAQAVSNVQAKPQTHTQTQSSNLNDDIDATSKPAFNKLNKQQVGRIKTIVDRHRVYPGDVHRDPVHIQHNPGALVEYEVFHDSLPIEPLLDELAAEKHSVDVPEPSYSEKPLPSATTHEDTASSETLIIVKLDLSPLSGTYKVTEASVSVADTTPAPALSEQSLPLTRRDHQQATAPKSAPVPTPALPEVTKRPSSPRTNAYLEALIERTTDPSAVAVYRILYEEQVDITSSLGLRLMDFAAELLRSNTAQKADEESEDSSLVSTASDSIGTPPSVDSLASTLETIVRKLDNLTNSVGRQQRPNATKADIATSPSTAVRLPATINSPLSLSPMQPKGRFSELTNKREVLLDMVRDLPTSPVAKDLAHSLQGNTNLSKILEAARQLQISDGDEVTEAESVWTDTEDATSELEKVGREVSESGEEQEEDSLDATPRQVGVLHPPCELSSTGGAPLTSSNSRAFKLDSGDSGEHYLDSTIRKPARVASIIPDFGLSALKDDDANGYATLPRSAPPPGRLLPWVRQHSKLPPPRLVRPLSSSLANLPKSTANTQETRPTACGLPAAAHGSAPASLPEHYRPVNTLSNAPPHISTQYLIDGAPEIRYDPYSHNTYPRVSTSRALPIPSYAHHHSPGWSAPPWKPNLAPFDPADYRSTFPPLSSFIHGEVRPPHLPHLPHGSYPQCMEMGLPYPYAPRSAYDPVSAYRYTHGL